MTLKIKYFGMAAEASARSQEELENQYTNIKELKTALSTKYPKLASINFKMAVNHSLVGENYSLTGNEEIALLPPFAGG